MFLLPDRNVRRRGRLVPCRRLLARLLPAWPAAPVPPNQRRVWMNDPRNERALSAFAGTTVDAGSPLGRAFLGLDMLGLKPSSTCPPSLVSSVSRTHARPVNETFDAHEPETSHYYFGNRCRARCSQRASCDQDLFKRPNGEQRQDDAIPGLRRGCPPRDSGDPTPQVM
jgi:hypothetical protein